MDEDSRRINRSYRAGRARGEDPRRRFVECANGLLASKAGIAHAGGAAGESVIELARAYELSVPSIHDIPCRQRLGGL
jgi:hypothetical protein